jgi:hypothetical protein
MMNGIVLVYYCGVMVLFDSFYEAVKFYILKIDETSG